MSINRSLFLLMLACLFGVLCGCASTPPPAGHSQTAVNSDGTDEYDGWLFKSLTGQGKKAKASQPAAVLASGLFSISAATPGAAVFYTLDGSNPTPRNGSLYSAPVAVAPGQTLKARAWLAGFLASETLTVAN